MKLPYINAKNFDRLITLAAFLFAAVTVWLLAGCNGQIGRSGGPKKQSFVLVMHNNDIGYPASMTVSWWRGSTVVGTEWREIPGGGESVFLMGSLPDGFMVQVVGWSPNPAGGLGWGSPEYRDGNIFHVYYPSGWSYSEKLGR